MWLLSQPAKGLYDQNALPKETAKRASKKHCPTVIIAQIPPQWNLPISIAALPSTNFMMTSNHASKKSLHDKPALAPKTEISKGKGQHKSTCAKEKSHRAMPHLTTKNDKSHIHSTLPIHGLPLENQSIYLEKITTASQCTKNSGMLRPIKEYMAYYSPTNKDPKRPNFPWWLPLPDQPNVHLQCSQHSSNHNRTISTHFGLHHAAQ